MRELVAPGAHVDQVLEALDGAELPEPVCKTLRRALRQALSSEAQAVEEAVERVETVLSLPWRTRAPERFDATHLKRALDHTHGGLEGVKTRLIEVLAASPQTCGPLTVEGPRRGAEAETQAAALVVRPGRPRAEVPVPCLAGARGTGKTSLAVAVAQALGRPHVRIWLGKGNPESLIRGVKNGVTGRIVDGLCEAGVDNPVFVLEGLDRVESEAAEALLDVLDPARRPAFRDEYPPGPVRPVPGRVDRDGGRSGRDTGGGTQADRGDRDAGVHRGGEAGHRAAVPAEAPVRRVRTHGGDVPVARAGGGDGK